MKIKECSHSRNRFLTAAQFYLGGKSTGQVLTNCILSLGKTGLMEHKEMVFPSERWMLSVIGSWGLSLKQNLKSYVLIWSRQTRLQGKISQGRTRSGTLL